MTRRELLALAAAAPVLAAKTAPTAPVSIAKVPTYNDDLVEPITRMFDQIGGAGKRVKNKTVTIKLNLTGSPGLRLQGKPLGLTHYSHPKLVFAMARVLNKAGARRIRFVESAWASGGPLEEYMLDAGWNARALLNLVPGVEMENTNNLGKGKKYSRFKVPGGGYLYPAYDLNHAFEDTDVFMRLAKLKNHETCGVTLSLKNCFGNSPASIYGDDAKVDEPNESPTSGRGAVFHAGKRGPAKSAPQELDPTTSRHAGNRVPRIVADLVAARPVDITLID